MDLLQFGLKPLRITDKPLVDGILSSKGAMLSSYAFVSHYIWRDIFRFYWGIIDDYLCLFAHYDDYIYMPIPPVLSNPSFNPIFFPFSKGGLISTIFSIMDKINKNKTASRIENIDECQIESFSSLGYDIRPGESEYLYIRENLANLKGDPYKSKRAMCNYFKNNYTYSYDPFQPSFVDECLRIYGEWKKEKKRKTEDPFYHNLAEDSLLAHKKAMIHYKSLQLTGRVVRINDQIGGYIFGFERGGDTFYILMEITNPGIKGLAQFIFREFCREMEDYRYINTLGDSGLGNLRRVKLSYRPYKILPAYVAYQP